MMAALTKAKAHRIKSSGAKQAKANRAAALAYAERLHSLVTPLAGEPLRAVVKHLDDCGILTPRWPLAADDGQAPVGSARPALSVGVPSA